MDKEKELNSDTALEINEVNFNNAFIQNLLNIFNKTVDDIRSSDQYDAEYKGNINFKVKTANDVESLITNISLLASCARGKKSGDSNPTDLSKNIQSINYNNKILQNIHQLFSTYYNLRKEMSVFEDTDYYDDLVKNVTILLSDIDSENIINEKLLILLKKQLDIISNNGRSIAHPIFGKENKLFHNSESIDFDYDSLLLRTNPDKKAFEGDFTKNYVSFLPNRREQIYNYENYSDDNLGEIMSFIDIKLREGRIVNTSHLLANKLQYSLFQDIENAISSYFNSTDFNGLTKQDIKRKIIDELYPQLNNNESRLIIIKALEKEIRLLSHYPYKDEIDEKYTSILDTMHVNLTVIDSRFDSKKIYQLYSDLYDFNRKVYSVEYNREHGRLFINQELTNTNEQYLHLINTEDTEELSSSDNSDEQELTNTNEQHVIDIDKTEDLYPLSNSGKQSSGFRSIIKLISVNPIHRIFNRKKIANKKIGDQMNNKDSINFDSLQIPAIVQNNNLGESINRDTILTFDDNKQYIPTIKDIPSTSGIKGEIIEEENSLQDDISSPDSEIAPGSPLYEFLGGMHKFIDIHNTVNNQTTQNEISLGESLSEDNNKTEITKNIKNVRKFVSSCMLFCFRGVNKKTIVKRNKAIESPRISL